MTLSSGFFHFSFLRFHDSTPLCGLFPLPNKPFPSSSAISLRPFLTSPGHCGVCLSSQMENSLRGSPGLLVTFQIHPPNLRLSSHFGEASLPSRGLFWVSQCLLWGLPESLGTEHKAPGMLGLGSPCVPCTAPPEAWYRTRLRELC